MISSMTSYYSVSEETSYGCLALEIKTLNSRFFDLQIKLSDELRIYEPLIRKKIAKTARAIKDAPNRVSGLVE